jgi:dCMP deaminase
MAVAHAVAGGADCAKRRIGAVLIDTTGRVAATGYNGSRPGAPGCLSDGACPRAYTRVPAGSPYDDCISLHAEQNLLIYASWERLQGATIYITAAPCAWCRKLLGGSGIAKIVYAVGEEMIFEDV